MMRTQYSALIMLAAIIFTSMQSAFAADDDETDNPQLKLKTTLNHAKYLLDQKDYKSFLSKLAPPKMKARLLQKNTIEELAGKFSRKKASELLAVLTNLQENNVEPVMSNSDSKATYEFQLEGETTKRKLSFLKIKKMWFISNQK